MFGDRPESSKLEKPVVRVAVTGAVADIVEGFELRSMLDEQQLIAV